MSELAKFNQTLNSYTDNLTSIKNGENFLENEALQTFLGKQKEDFTKALQIPQAILTASTTIQSTRNLFEKVRNRYNPQSEPQQTSLKQPDEDTVDPEIIPAEEPPPQPLPRSSTSLNFNPKQLPFEDVEPVPLSRPVGTSSIASLPKAASRSIPEPEIPQPLPRIKTISQQPTSLTAENLEEDPFPNFLKGQHLSSTFVRNPVLSTSENISSDLSTAANAVSEGVSSGISTAANAVSEGVSSGISTATSAITEGVSAATDAVAEGVSLASSVALDSIPIIGEISSLAEIIGLAITGGDDKPAPQLNPKDFDASFRGLTVQGSYSNTRQAPPQAIF